MRQLCTLPDMVAYEDEWRIVAGSPTDDYGCLCLCQDLSDKLIGRLDEFR